MPKGFLFACVHSRCFVSANPQELPRNMLKFKAGTRAEKTAIFVVIKKMSGAVVCSSQALTPGESTLDVCNASVMAQSSQLRAGDPKTTQLT